MNHRLLCISSAAILGLCLPFVAHGQVVENWLGDGTGNYQNGNWSDASLWSSGLVPNNGGGTTYNVTVPYYPIKQQFSGPELDIDVTVSNLTFVDRVFLENQAHVGTNLTVTGTTSFTTSSGHDGEYGAVFFAGGTFSMGNLANYNAATHTLNGMFLFPLAGGTIQFNNADIFTNNATVVVGDGSRLLNQTNGQDAYEHLAVNNGTFNLGGGHSFTTSGNFTNNGTFALSNGGNAATTFTVGGTLTNFNASTHTLTNGDYTINADAGAAPAALRFAGADIRTIENASVTLIGAAASITDLQGNNAFRFLSTLTNGAFNSAGTQTIAPPTGVFALDSSTHNVASGSNITVQGNYQQTGGATNLGGGDSDTFLTVNGSSLINGGRFDLGGQPGVNTIYTTTLRIINGIEFRGAFLTGTGTIFADTLVTNGTVLAPGHSPGALTVQGKLTLDPGVFLQLQIGGLSPGDEYDLLAQTGPETLTLGGELQVTFIDGFEQSIAQSDLFHIITSENLLAGSFDNVASGSRIMTADGAGSFLVTYTGGTDVILSDFQAVPEPGTLGLVALSGLGGWLTLRLRRRAMSGAAVS